MRPFKVRFTLRAQKQLDRADTWWRKHRLSAPDLLLREAEAAVARLAEAPLIGVPIQRPNLFGVRRVLLRGCGYHLYYKVKAETREVQIRAVWHASRGREPSLR